MIIFAIFNIMKNVRYFYILGGLNMNIPKNSKSCTEQKLESLKLQKLTPTEMENINGGDGFINWKQARKNAIRLRRKFGI